MMCSQSCLACNFFTAVIYSRNDLDSTVPRVTYSYIPKQTQKAAYISVAGPHRGPALLMFCAQPDLILTLELFICDNNKTICLSFSHPCAWHHGDNKMGKMYLNSLEIGALPVTDAINWYCLIVRWCQHIHWLAAEPVPVLGSITKTGWGSRKDPVQNKWIHPGRL